MVSYTGTTSIDSHCTVVARLGDVIVGSDIDTMFNANDVSEWWASFSIDLSVSAPSGTFSLSMECTEDDARSIVLLVDDIFLTSPDFAKRPFITS